MLFRRIVLFVLCFGLCHGTVFAEEIQTEDQFVAFAHKVAYKAHLNTIIQNGQGKLWFENEKFRKSIWDYVANALAENSVKNHNKNEVIHIKSTEYNLFSGANWNALLLKNFINRALDASVSVIDENLVDETASFLLCAECSGYTTALLGTPEDGQKNGAVGDIKIYAKALGLYDYLKDMKAIIAKNSPNIAPKVSGKFDKSRKTGTLEFQDFRPKLNGTDILDTGEKLRLTIDHGVPSHFCYTRNRMVTLDYTRLSVSELKFPDFLARKGILVADGMAMSISGYETEYVNCPIYSYSSLDVPCAHTYEACFPAPFAADIPIGDITLPDDMTKKSKKFQISMQSLASSFISKTDEGYLADCKTFALKPQWIFARDFPENAGKSQYVLKSNAKANVVVYDAKGGKKQVELSRNLLHLHGNSVSPRGSLYINEVDNDNVSRAILYDIEFEEGTLEIGGEHSIVPQKEPRQGVILLLSNEDRKLWDDNIDSGMLFALKNLSIMKNAEVRKLLRMPD
ncbi:MAG: hypothetical protein IJ599_00985 [Alphaproteobacteria bacterium]|nr:hypothetical protein [Alphaproteobacteria bacterium]